MGLNKSKGNMYDFITHTWNAIKGKCEHDCSYCYVKRWGKLNPVRFDEKELKTDLGKDNFIFVGSSCDMWSKNIPKEWIEETLAHCNNFDNKYLLQTKNPSRILDFIHKSVIRNKSIVCTTIESNIFYKEHMQNSPDLWLRAEELNEIAHAGIKTYVTIEPIMDFDLDEMAHYIETCLPEQVNIGADSGGNNLPEPSKEKVLELITELEKFTKVKQKKNLSRLLK
jgi:DNA repair photolyase